MNPITQAVIEAIERVGSDVVVEVGPDSVEASATLDGHTHIITGDDPY